MHTNITCLSKAAASQQQGDLRSFVKPRRRGRSSNPRSKAPCRSQDGFASIVSPTPTLTCVEKISCQENALVCRSVRSEVKRHWREIVSPVPCATILGLVARRKYNRRKSRSLRVHIWLNDDVMRMGSPMNAVV
ncbi:hypothetical protein PoB_002533600 [Plakobranchus ocellatus]|uniref:Uncharacterized protein n=1 Tax=Plakobranchus ocellatus TaxID=259542 RepID=A0AAV3ZWB6_9GAST|nr:hypothetical protein PoB_002533600 [Plakobranchus ocellatus]